MSAVGGFEPIPAGARVLVTGATGFTGRVLMRQLAAAGADLRAIARGSSDLSPLAGLPVRCHRGDVFDPAVVREAAEGAEYVFHVAALYREARNSARSGSLAVRPRSRSARCPTPTKHRATTRRSLHPKPLSQSVRSRPRR